MRELNIIPECFADTKVAEIVGRALRKYNHQHGCGNVANLMKTKFKDRVALGIIDEDKDKGPQSKYFLNFEILTTKDNLMLKRHSGRMHYLIVVQPEIEEWLLGNAEVADINPKDYDLPFGLKGLKQITKNQNIDKNNEFYRFIKELIQRNSPGLRTLGEWISLFNSDNLDTLRNE